MAHTRQLLEMNLSGVAGAVPSMKRRPPPQSPPDAAGGAPAARAPPFTVALDLEHTLVCPTAADRAPEGPHDHLRSWVVRVGEREVRVYERPGVREFLSALQALGAELHLFTSGVPGYAAPVLDRLEAAAGVTFAARHFRPAAPTASACICARDLRVLGRDLARTVLVDDSPQSFRLQPENGVPVPPFRPGPPGPGDAFLVRDLLPVLRELAARPDVRPELDRLRRRREAAARAAACKRGENGGGAGTRAGPRALAR